MRDVGHITEETYQKALETPVQFYVEGPNKEEAQYFVEIVRQMLVAKLGEAAVLDGGLRIDTALDLKAQREANQQVRNGLHEVDKRQGYRGPLRRLTDPKEQDDFLLKTRNRLKAQASPTRVLLPDGSVEPDRPLEIYHKKDAQGRIVGNIPPYVTKELLIEALVTRVDDGLGLVHVRFADAQGLIDISDMAWARKPDPAVNFDVAPKITKPSAVLKTGDVILIRVVSERFVSPRFSRPLMDPNTKKPMVLPSFAEFAQVALEQEPLVQGALLSFDLKTQDIIAMVGGYDFQKDKFNRSIQANRQTGSSFKTIVYAAALDKGFTAATPIQDAPVVYDSEAAEGQEADERKWKPHNHGEKFAGDILFRTALVRSLNIPTVKILEQVGVGWVIDYGRRLGLFSQLNNDLSLGLGSSSVTLYEMTKVFAHFARLGQRIQPVLVRKVTDPSGRVLVENISLDLRFQNEIGPIEQSFEQRRTEFLEKESSGSSADSGGQNLMENALAADGGSVPATPTPDPKLNKTPRIFFSDPERMMSAQTAYVMTSLLQGTITDEGGTAARARALGRPAAGKTGTTNGYFDAWFIGYTPQISTGVWVGFNEEKSLGAGEVGGRSALPIWLDYMLGVHKDLPTQAFPIPSGIVFANIDSQTGELASASSKGVINQAFVSGTEPSKVSGAPSSRDEGDFFKDDLAQ
jgi:penicillin-binding protein 1A